MCQLVLSCFPKVVTLVSGVIQLPCKLFLGEEGTSLRRSPCSEVGLSHLPSLIPSWGGMVPWVVNSYSLACHLLLILSHYFSGSESNPLPSSGMSTGGNPFQDQWNHAQGSYPSQGMSSRGNPLSRDFPFARDVSKGQPYFVLQEPDGWRFSSI
jgi:hypothetical protein